MIADHPVFGVGPGNFYLLFPKYRPPDYQKIPGLGGETYEAHNEPLQVLAETGPLGFLTCGRLLFVA